MPKNLTPQDQWETEFQVPLPGEPRNIGPLETLFQRLLNRTERLKGRIAAILGLPWDATPPDTLAGLAGRVENLEAAQGGTTLSAHRTAPVLDHPDGSVTASKLAPGAAVANIGYTPVNRAGDTMTGNLTVPSITLPQATSRIHFSDKRAINVYVDHGGDTGTRYYYLGHVHSGAGILKVQGILGGHAQAQGRANVDLQFSYRDGFRVDGEVIGKVGQADIYVYEPGDGDIYIYLVTKEWALVNLELSAVGPAWITYDGTFSYSAPTFGGQSFSPIYLLSTDASANTLRVDEAGNVYVNGTINGKLAPGFTPYDLAIFYPGTPPSGALLAALTVPRNLSLQGGSVVVGTAPSADWSATIYNGGTAIGTVSVLAGRTSGTVTLNTTPTSFGAGALLRIVGPATANSAIRDISIALQGVV
ncbi:hypothetical protein KQ693_10220 [Thermus sp. PS18]|uniref:hypothetical protein n=1 Tax=Thermus sp. PS18 TaxID=2849039 RepID=UPI002264357D|nr:hypothetical protein [Thermus sp. PS18]UZX14991.1 hypothetical protein KQ693_10220 [Thermus sp. PS18]